MVFQYLRSRMGLEKTDVLCIDLNKEGLNNKLEWKQQTMATVLSWRSEGRLETEKAASRRKCTETGGMSYG